MKRFFNPSEIAKLCDVSTGSVIRWIHEGKLPSASTGGGHYRVLKEDVHAFLKTLRMPLPEESSTQKEIKVLIVDDEEPIRKMLRSLLKQNFPGTLIEEANDEFMAGWKARDFRPDLIILDIRLPNLDGFKVCQSIRGYEALKHTRILAITGLQETEVSRKILDLGADDFLLKPFGVSQMKEKIMDQLKVLKNEETKNDS